MKKIILWSIVSLVVAGLAVNAFLWLHKTQTITLADGTKLTLLGVEYGKHHKFPAVKTKSGVRRNYGGGPSSFDTTNATLVVWILQETKGNNQRYSWQPLIYDRAETACVQSWPRNWNQAGVNRQVAAAQLDAFPRHDRKFFLRVQSWDNHGQRVSKEQFVISNPARVASSPKWTPESLPDTQSDGDLDVTLTKLVTGVQSPYNRGNGVPRNDPSTKGVQLDFDVQQKGQSATNWSPVRVVTSDATGNSVQGWINAFNMNGQESGYFYREGLWPDEPAWKLRLEFSRTSGFGNDEIWAVNDVPVQPGTQQDAGNLWGNFGRTKPAFAEATVNGIHVKLFPAIQYSDPNNGGAQAVSFYLKTDPDPEAEGMRLTVLQADDDQGRDLQSRGSSWGGGNYQYEYVNTRSAKALNLTFAIHKSRFVEFTAKPAKADVAAAQ